MMLSMTNEAQPTGSQRFELFADYFQFYVQDDDATTGPDGDSWTQDAASTRLACGERFIAVATSRNTEVPVTIDRIAGPPAIHADASHVVEADIVVSTGRLVVAGCTDDFNEAARVDVAPGRHRARVSFRGRSDDEDGMGDHYDYIVELWPTAQPADLAILVAGDESWSG